MVLGHILNSVLLELLWNKTLSAQSTHAVILQLLLVYETAYWDIVLPPAKGVYSGTCEKS